MGNRQESNSPDDSMTKENLPLKISDNIPGISFEYQFGCDLINDSFCCICFHDYYQGMMLQILPCNHIIHKDCMSVWYKKSPTCPLCRINFINQPINFINQHN
jgi:hypothetical protein